ncbi:MAG: hypothetical protein K2H72_02465, partial [Muribaculaceae bacterium]|nr:hypothetical protein [Muribaculaceae bacterium]
VARSRGRGEVYTRQPSAPSEWSREVFADKIHTLCTEILDAYANDSRPLKDWSKFIENVTDANVLGMTVGEFLSSRCFSILGEYADTTQDLIPFFTASATPVPPGQKCAALRDKAIDRLIESAAGRGQSLLLARALSDKANTLPYSMRMKSLLNAYSRLKGTEGEQLILSNLRDFLNQDPAPGMKSVFPYSNKEYIDILQKSVADFPNGRYVNSLKNIINDLTRPSAEFRYKGQYLSSSEITIDAKLTNCNESWILVYDYAPYAASPNSHPKNSEVAARCLLVKAIKLSAEGSIPFSADVKANAGKLSKGTYVLIPSASPDSKGIYPTILNDTWRQPFLVSDITAMTLKYPDAKTSVFVVDGSDGHPIEGAQVKVYSRKNYSSARQLVKTLTTDKDGCVSVTEERFEFEALYRGSVWKSDMRYYNSTARRDTVVRSNVQ